MLPRFAPMIIQGKGTKITIKRMQWMLYLFCDEIDSRKRCLIWSARSYVKKGFDGSQPTLAIRA